MRDSQQRNTCLFLHKFLLSNRLDFLKSNSRDLEADLYSLNLTFYDLVIDYTKLEIKLNYSRPWSKNIKR